MLPGVEQGRAMGSSRETADYICEQAAGAGPVSARRMFGEYGVYVAGKMVALICDDQLFVKPTQAGRAWLERETGEAPAMGRPHPRANPYFAIPGEFWDDASLLSRLLRETALELPEPKPKKPKSKPQR
ncbi:MAG: hypothetical protein JWN07_141 [Hyphomicrobiales bacterium]|jgi:DNA transformation protein|nr:hypothetical protein [Hyphomicrobiales bacterium]